MFTLRITFPVTLTNNTPPIPIRTGEETLVIGYKNFNVQPLLEILCQSVTKRK